MRAYECMVIFDADLDEEKVRGKMSEYQSLISSNGGELASCDVWGKRKFAFRLKKRWEGTYVVMKWKSQTAVLEPLDRTLTLADEVLRHKILRIPDDVYAKSLAGASS